MTDELPRLAEGIVAVCFAFTEHFLKLNECGLSAPGGKDLKSIVCGLLGPLRLLLYFLFVLKVTALGLAFLLNPRHCMTVYLTYLTVIEEVTQDMDGGSPTRSWGKRVMRRRRHHTTRT